MKRILCFAWLVAFPAFAQKLYVVPVFATRILGASGQSTAHVHVFNPGSPAANVTITNIYASGGVLDCPLAPGTQTLAPLESSDLIRPFCGANQVAAYTIASDHPVVITDDIETAGSGHVEHQSVRVLDGWLPADQPAVVPNVALASSGTDRTNLFLVNPNAFLITVSVHVVSSVQSALPTQELNFDVPAGTTIIRPLPTSFIVCASLRAPCVTATDLVVQANGIFYAGASWLENDDPVYRNPALIDE